MKSVCKFIKKRESNSIDMVNNFKIESVKSIQSYNTNMNYAKRHRFELFSNLAEKWMCVKFSKINKSYTIK